MELLKQFELFMESEVQNFISKEEAENYRGGFDASWIPVIVVNDGPRDRENSMHGIVVCKDKSLVYIFKFWCDKSNGTMLVDKMHFTIDLIKDLAAIL